MHESLLDLVGGTPLVRLRRVTDGIAAPVYVKLEYLNPGGSVKDRAATAMVLDAERSGALAPGGTIVEGSSGNTGTGLAQAAATRGYRMICVLPDTTAQEKVAVLRAYGAEIVLTSPALPREHPDQVEQLATRIARETPGGWFADQYGNPANPEVHRRTTGPEIWADTGGAVTHLVCSIGTGGTISGTAEYLRSVAGEGRVTVVGADPATSVFGGGDGSPFLVEAAGRYRHPDTVDDTWPAAYHRDVVDRVESIPDRESVTLVRRLAHEEGLLVGGSSGLVTATALRVARSLPADALVVAVLPDSGRGYLSKYHSTDWLRRTGFLDDDRPGLLAGTDAVGAVETVATTATRGEAAARLAASGQPLLPVVRAGRDSRFATAASEILGALASDDLDGDPDAPVDVPEGGAPPSVGIGETPAEALERLPEGADVAVVLRDGRLAGLVTRSRLAELAELAAGATDEAGASSRA